MSTKLLTQVRKWQVGPGLVKEGGRKVVVSEPPRKTVLHFLADHANDDGVCRLAQLTLVVETGWSKVTIRRALESLEIDGWIERAHRYGKRGWRVADEIRLVPMEERPSAHGGQALEAFSKSVKSPALIGPAHLEEEIHMRVLDLRDEGASGYLEEKPPKKSTRPTKAKKPERWNPVTLSQYFGNNTRVRQWGHANPAPAKMMAGTFRRWHDVDGVTYREIAVAIDLFFDQFPADLEAPAGRLFIKQGFQWIAEAKGEIYQADLPQVQATSREMQRELHQLHDVWIAQHPEATEDERDIQLAAYWRKLKTERPEYAALYT